MKQICPSSAHPNSGRFPRTSALYWRSRVERTISPNGLENTFYSARIVYRNRRVRFPLETSNKNEAAGKAAKIFGSIVENGWEATILEFKPNAKLPAQDFEPLKGSTVGDLIAASRKYCSARPSSFNCYVRALRRVVSGVMLLDEQKKISRKKKEGYTAWRNKIDALPLCELTPARIQEWKQFYLKSSGTNAKAKRSATTTVNSLIRNCKALFAKKLLPFLEEDLDLPSPLPFQSVTLEKPPSPRYRSRIEAKSILSQSHEELREQSPEAYKILRLALVCGLRVSEIDHLLWEAFDFDAKLLEIQNSEYHQLKSEDSAGEINLSDEMADLFETYSESATGIFVIESDRKPLRTPGSSVYRCQKPLKILKSWLKAKGITANKPIHELRKEIGSVIASEQGIFAASRYLRHSDIRITATIYADQKEKVVPSIASFI